MHNVHLLPLGGRRVGLVGRKGGVFFLTWHLEPEEEGQNNEQAAEICTQKYIYSCGCCFFLKKVKFLIQLLRKLHFSGKVKHEL